jgi:hypothetical protein
MDIPERLKETVLNLDLAGRIPYGVRVWVDQEALINYDSDWSKWDFNENPQELDTISASCGVSFSGMDQWDGFIPIKFIKPYLIPLSKLTEDDLSKLRLRSIIDVDRIKEGKFEFDGIGNLEDIFSIIEEFHKNHIDYRGLIELDLAIDSTIQNIYDNL